MTTATPGPKDAYDLVLDAIDHGVFRPGDRLVESELAERFGVSRTPIREALQRLEAQSVLTRDGRSLVVSSLDPHRTFLGLVGEGALPRAFLDSVRRYKLRGSSGKVNLALDALPDFSCLPGAGTHLHGAISISPSVDYMERAYDEAKNGDYSKRPYMVIS